MYIPKHFAMPLEDAVAHLQSHPFASVSYRVAENIEMMPMPLFLNAQQDRLLGHCPKHSPLGKSLSALNPFEIVASFVGTHGYISASWYQTPEMVPTWNYNVVEVRGTLTPLSSENTLAALAEQVNIMEAHESSPWDMSMGLSEKMRDTLAKALVCFEIRDLAISGKSKMSQNRTPAARSHAIEALKAREKFSLAQAMQVASVQD